MNVAAILARKGSEVITAAADAALMDAAKILDERRIGAVIILGPDRKPVGVLSERDITAAVARDGAAALTRRVSECMSRDVVICRPSDSLDALMERMTDRRIRHLPVMEGGRLAGVVSIGDVVKERIAEADAERDAMRSYIAAG